MGNVDPADKRSSFKWYLDLIEGEVNAFIEEYTYTYVDVDEQGDINGDINGGGDENWGGENDNQNEDQDKQLKIILLGHSAGGTCRFYILLFKTRKHSVSIKMLEKTHCSFPKIQQIKRVARSSSSGIYGR